MEIIKETIKKVDSIIDWLSGGFTQSDVRDALSELKELKEFLDSSPVDFFTAVEIKDAGYSIPCEYFYLDKELTFVKRGLKAVKNGRRMNHNRFDEFTYSAPTVKEYNRWLKKQKKS